jgi:hypothetical protein
MSHIALPSSFNVMARGGTVSWNRHITPDLCLATSWLHDLIYIIHNELSLHISGYENVYVHVENPIVELFVSGFQLVFGAFLPFVIILSCNVIIIITIKFATKERLKMEFQGEGEGHRKRKETKHLTRMLVFVSVAYVVTTVPYRFYPLIINLPGVAYDFTNEYWFLRFSAEYEFLFVVFCCNYACNFYLYCVGGGQRYRTDTVEILSAFFHYCPK